MELKLKNKTYSIKELEKIFNKKANIKLIEKIKDIKKLGNRNRISREINDLYISHIGNNFGGKWSTDYKIIIILFGYKGKCNTITFTAGKPVICENECKLNSSRCSVHHKDNVGRQKGDIALVQNQNSYSTGAKDTKQANKDTHNAYKKVGDIITKKFYDAFNDDIEGLINNINLDKTIIKTASNSERLNLSIKQKEDEKLFFINEIHKIKSQLQNENNIGNIAVLNAQLGNYYERLFYLEEKYETSIVNYNKILESLAKQVELKEKLISLNREKVVGNIIEFGQINNNGKPIYDENGKLMTINDILNRKNDEQEKLRQRYESQYKGEVNE